MPAAIRVGPMILLVLALGTLPAASLRPDRLLADFEGEDYGAWKAEGPAFGTQPARAALPRQMPVAGFQGRGFATSYHGGDPATGTLASPDFTIDRRYLSFLIGGGGFPGLTCLDLVIDGKTVRSATGPNTEPGGSERLDRDAWDLQEFQGRTARLVATDRATGGWGHLNLDHVLLTDARPVITVPVARRRDIVLDRPYLLLPVDDRDPRKSGPLPRLALVVQGQVVREMEIALSENPAWFAHLDVSAWKGQRAELRASRLTPGSTALDRAAAAETIWQPETLYREPLRPQLHFSARRGWLNDPNGLVFHQGEYHLFFQHNPVGWHWGNMHWGHAVSRDLLHWRELPIALVPPRFGDWAFSGSAVVDRDNTSGWMRDHQPPLVVAFTSTGRGECITRSLDQGRTWTEFEHNPVIRHAGRDPRLLWHTPTRRWVMAVYDETNNQRSIAFHTSSDLKAWTFASRIEGFYECPDLFELPVAGQKDETRWVLTAADSRYRLGRFDGAVFHPETALLPGSLGVGYYAAQTVSHDPKGRVIKIGWLQAPSPGMPFNQCLSLPAQLGLRATPEGVRLTRVPIEELTTLRKTARVLPPGRLTPGADPLAGQAAEVFELVVRCAPPSGSRLVFDLRGIPMDYDALRQELTVGKHRVRVPLVEGALDLRLYVDRTVLELFAQEGLVHVTMPAIPEASRREVRLRGEGAAIPYDRLEIYELHSIWRGQ